MKKLITICLILSLVGASSAYVETFDSGSANWKYGYGTNFTPGTTTWNATGGNPDGYISGASQKLYAIWTYDTASYGDLTGLSLTIDTKVTDSETGTAQLYIGRDGTYYIDGTWAIGNDTDWTTHTVALESSHFTRWTQGGAGTASFEYVLAAPDDMGIFFGGSVAIGSGSILVDNFGTVPEPATLLLLGLGGLFCRKIKRA